MIWYEVHFSISPSPVILCSYLGPSLGTNPSVKRVTQITANSASVANTTTANNARIVATAVLAIMLRYATFIQPPSIISIL